MSNRFGGAAEVLESRQLLTLSFGTPLVNSVPAGKAELIALPIVNSTANPVSYTVQSDTVGVSANVIAPGKSILMHVSGVDSTNTAFTGDITLRLIDDGSVPLTLAQIEDLVNTGFYNGKTFHRVIPGFVAQGGDPNGNGTGGSGHTIPDEYKSNLTFTGQGMLAMANSGDDTGDSQFFITAIDENLSQLPQNLNFNHTIFGILTNGFDTFRKMMATPTGANDKPTTNLVINSATIVNDTQFGVLRVSPSATAAAGTANITVTANDGNGNTAQKIIPVSVVADTINDRAFLGSVIDQTAVQGKPVQFTVQGFDNENDTLTFVVKDAASFTGNNAGSAPTNVTVQISTAPAANGNPSVATITLTPAVTFSGVVRDQTARDGTSIDSRVNFDGQTIKLTVTAVNHAPNAPGGSVSTPSNTAVNIQLPGDDGDADKTQLLTYEIVTQPATGTISNFDGTAGTLVYTPASNASGLVTFTYRIKDNGGTANSGEDTSPIATMNVNVGSITPTALALTAGSDDGMFNNDRVTSDGTPTFTASAQPGSTVTFRVNDTTNVPASETTPGVFTATLAPSQLKVGANSLTATATLNGSTSTATAPLAFTYTPDYSQLYTVPGTFAASQQLTFQLVSKNSAYRSEFGLYVVDGAGAVGGVAASSAGYTQAALSSATRQVIFAPGTASGAVKTITLTGGQLVGYYLADNATGAEALRSNPSNKVGGPSVFFSVDAANPDKIDHVHILADNQSARELLYWEDMRGGGDRDYNDIVIGVTPGATASVGSAEALRLPSAATQTVSTSFKLLAGDNPTSGGKSKADGEIGLFFVTDAGGTVNLLAPSAAGYIQAVLGSNTRQVLFNAGDSLGTQKTLSLTGGSLLGWYYIPGGTTANVLANNATNDAAKSPVVFMSFDAANPDDASHFRWFGTERNGVTHSAGDAQGPLRLHLVGGLNPDTAAHDDYQIAITLPG
ncbi:MAG: peptidylprolyl isomerase [Planctomycetota bacterium]|nr:peptidylprolyl isomerase [Planctomycetota bacterium]